jgi:hypothetical protein
LAGAFNDFRRSRVIFQLALIVRLGLAKPEGVHRRSSAADGVLIPGLVSIRVYLCVSVAELL